MIRHRAGASVGCAPAGELTLGCQRGGSHVALPVVSIAREVVMRTVGNPWDWGVALGRAAGPAIGAGTAAAIAAGLATGGLGAPLGGAIAGGGAFIGSFLGSVFGHWADDQPLARETFRSGLLFTMV